MAKFSFNNVKIAAVAAAVPAQKRLSTDFADIFGKENVDKFIETTGVVSHYESFADQCASDLAFAAAEELLTKKNIDRESIGALIFITQSSDYRRPSAACVLQSRLGLSQNCMAFEIALGCSAYVYGVHTAAGLMQSSDISRVLLLCAETTTKLEAEGDSSVAMLFGDAGTATLLEKCEGAAPLTGVLKTDGNRFGAIIAPAGGFRQMDAPRDRFVCRDGNERTLYDLHMDGMNVFSFTITDVPRTFKEFFKEHEIDPESTYDNYCLHQANFMTLKQISKRLKLSWDKFLISMDRFGNTSGATLPLTMCDAFGDKSEGEKRLFMSGFGTGLSWGIIDAVVNTDDIFPVIETTATFPEGVFTPEML